MKTLKETVIVCLFMLMVSMNVMAQRETLTFNGIMANFPHGGSAETVLTIKPDGKYVFDVKKSKTVEPFTISGQMPVPIQYDKGHFTVTQQYTEGDSFCCNCGKKIE